MPSQEDRFIVIETPLGEDVLLLTGISGTEGLSTLFSFNLNLISERHDISFEDIIGANVTIAFILSNQERRYINGIISRFSQTRVGGVDEDEEIEADDPRYSHYTATLVPWCWGLTQTTDSRIFQNLTIPDIIERIFDEYGFQDYQLSLTATYTPRVYCVQYRETDFNFITRLLEEEGIFFFFQHENGRHVLILGDSPEAHRPCPEHETVRCQSSGGGWIEEDVISGIEIVKEIRPNKYAVNDYNFEIPNANMQADAPGRERLWSSDLEVYEYPGGYNRRDEGERVADIRMQEREAQITQLIGTSDCRSFTSGYRFRLASYHREDLNDKEYVLKTVSHQLRQGGGLPGMGSNGSNNEPVYSNQFECIPHEIPYRPPQRSLKPIVRGVQTAIVVGPPGEEIYTDEHGRVKVQFHWDREGNRDENSSCWIRVSQGWAGAGWGSVSIPRIGQEVIVDFIEGDPDCPIITGRVYHGANRPPYDLPAGGVVSGLKSESTPGGGGYNEISMNDTKGKEGMTIHAQYNMDTTVENDQTLTVHNNRTSTVDVDETHTAGNNQSVTIGASQTTSVGSSQSLTVGAGQTITVGADRSIKVGANDSVSIAGKRALTVGASDTVTVAADHSLSVGTNLNITTGANASIKVGGATEIIAGGNVTIQAAGTIKLVAGGSVIEIGAGGINITSGGIIKQVGAMIKHNA